MSLVYAVCMVCIVTAYRYGAKTAVAYGWNEGHDGSSSS